MVSCDALKRAISLVAILMAATLVQPAAAQPGEPSTRPNRPMLDRRTDQQPQRPWRERLGSYDSVAGTGALTEQEVVEVRRFMETHSPRRMRRLEDVPRHRQDDIYDRIRAQYHAMQRLREQDPQIYELRLKRLPVEDEMFALGWRLKHDEEMDSTEAQELREKLRARVRQFVENSLEERRLRLERNAQRLRNEQQAQERAQAMLEQLTREKEGLIEKALQGIENERGDVLKELSAPFLPLQRSRALPASEPSVDAGDELDAQ